MPDITLPPSLIPRQTDGADHESIELTLANGTCPWCPDYTGDHPERHASKAHPEAWSDYKDSREE